MHRLKLSARWRTIVIATCVSAALLAAIGVAAYGVGYRHGGVDPAEMRPLLPVTAPSATPSVLPLTDIARDVFAQVVTIEVVREGSQAVGTAWLFDDRGDFVTNAHVVQGERAVRLRDREGGTHVATVVGSDREQDLAIVRSADVPSGAALPVDREDQLLPEDVVAISASRSPGHDEVIADRILRAHVDVPVRGNADIDPGGAATTVIYRDMLSLDGARIYSGNSGGPVLNPRGRVVGIVTLASRSAPQAYAIPIRRVIDRLLALARQGR